MPIPTAVKTVTLTAGPYTDYAGNLLRGTMTVTPSVVALVWGATGTPLIRSDLKVELVQGSATIVLPATDQAGFLAGGVGVKDWVYKVSFDLIDADEPAPIQVALPAAVPNVDLDLLQGFDGETNKPVWLPNVWSVNGMSGAVTIDIPKAYVPLHINPMDAPYNAKGDGKTDDTAAIQAALDAAMAVTGSSVELPARTFLVSTIGIDYSLAKWAAQPESGEPYGYSAPTVRGQGSKKTKFLQKTGSAGDVFVVSGKTGTDAGPANNGKATGVRLEGFEIVGTSSGTNGLRLRSLVNCRFSDLAIRNCGRSGIYFERETFVSGQDDEYSYSNSFHDIKSTSNGEWGYATSGAAAIGATFYDCEAIGNNIGGWFLTPTNMTLVGCSAIGSGAGGFATRGLLAVKNTNATSFNSSLLLINFRSENNAGVDGVEVEIASGVGYTILNPNFIPTGGAHCLSIGTRALGSTSYVQSPTVIGGYYGTTTNTFPNQKAIIFGSDSRNALVKGGRFNFQGSLNTADALITDGGFMTSVELPGNVRFGANGVLSLQRSLTAAPGGRGGEAQLFQRVNANSKIEFCVKMPTGDPIVLATQA
jgi:hypothetical protein